MNRTNKINEMQKCITFYHLFNKYLESFCYILDVGDEQCQSSDEGSLRFSWREFILLVNNVMLNTEIFESQ